MTTRISLPIAPHEDGVHCGDCPRKIDCGDPSNPSWLCMPFEKTVVPATQGHVVGPARCEECLAAEKREALLVRWLRHWQEAEGACMMEFLEEQWQDAGLEEFPSEFRYTE